MGQAEHPLLRRRRQPGDPLRRVGGRHERQRVHLQPPGGGGPLQAGHPAVGLARRGDPLQLKGAIAGEDGHPRRQGQLHGEGRPQAGGVHQEGRRGAAEGRLGGRLRHQRLLRARLGRRAAAAAAAEGPREWSLQEEPRPHLRN